jgi:branched-chain amino acid transport system permease protein
MELQAAKAETFPSSLVWRFTPLALLLLISLIYPWIVSPLWIRIGTEVLMWAGLAQSWNVIGGYTGYLCFGHGAFFGVGAYITGLRWSMWVAFRSQACFRHLASAALIIGYPTLRFARGFFAIAAWANGEMIRRCYHLASPGSFGLGAFVLISPYYVILVTVAYLRILLLERPVWI